MKNIVLVALAAAVVMSLATPSIARDKFRPIAKKCEQTNTSSVTCFAI